jgi:hypothetical protein
MVLLLQPLLDKQYLEAGFEQMMRTKVNWLRGIKISFSFDEY